MTRIPIGPKHLGLVALAVLVVAALALPDGRPATAADRTLRFGHIWPPEGGWGGAAQRFADLVGQRTGGKIAIKVFPSSQLGNERELEEGLQIGNVDFTFGGPGVLTNFDPAIGIFDMPFMFRDYAHANRVMDGPIGQQVWDSLRGKAGIRVLGSGAQGFRYILTRTRPVKAIDDLKGLKIRVPEAETFLRTFRLLGANPVGVPWGETYLAVQNGVVDGLEGVPDVILNQKMFEVGKYIAKTGHIMATLQLLMSEKTYQGLTPDVRKVIDETGLEVWQAQRAAAQAGNEKAEAELATKGLQLAAVDIKPFQAAVRPFWDEWAKKTGMAGVVDAIQKQ
jgi:tripartite ATP-independent transporter DctP family solute receptor